MMIFIPGISQGIGLKFLLDSGDFLNMLKNHSNAKASFIQSTRTRMKIFENHLNPFMLVFTG